MHDLAWNSKLSVAPMMALTDRHFRYMTRLISKHVLLYTEMVTSASLVRGGALHQLEYSDIEQPLALQLGGSCPEELSGACVIARDFGFNEVNLNVGCPSDRVQSGAFGAVLMKDPDLVCRCVEKMMLATDAEITVKCRIGVDDQIPNEILPRFIDQVRQSGVNRIIIHSRKAWLKGLSPKQNRDIPPLDWGLVIRMKTMFPDMHISLNGGVDCLEKAMTFLECLDGVMIGRAVYNDPFSLLSSADSAVYEDGHVLKSRNAIVLDMIEYIEEHCASGGRIHDVTRHMLGLFSGQKGARQWRRLLSSSTIKGPEDILIALRCVA